MPNGDRIAHQPGRRGPEIYGIRGVGLVPVMRRAAETTLPSKLYTIMASGRAVIAAVDEDSDIVATVCDANCGMALPPDDADALRAALLASVADRAQLRQYGANGRRYAEAHFSRQSVSGQYDALVRRLAKG